MLDPGDTNVYAEIRKSTLEPDSSRSKTGVNNGPIATPRARNQLTTVKAEDVHNDSLEDLTLIDNYIYKSSADCSKPARNSYLPGTSSVYLHAQTALSLPISKCCYINRFIHHTDRKRLRGRSYINIQQSYAKWSRTKVRMYYGLRTVKQ